MTDGFLSRIDVVKRAYQTQKLQFTGVVKTSEEELTQIASTFRDLEEQRLEVNRRIYQIRQAEIGLKTDEQEETLDLVFQEFNTFQRFLAAYLEENLGVREALQQQLDGYFAQDSMLELELSEYHIFQDNEEIALRSIPPYYQKIIKKAVQQQALRLKDCLDLEVKLNSLPDRSDGIVPLVLTINPEYSQMFWALPVAIRTEGQDGNFSQRMDGLENAFIQVLSLLAKDPDWTLIDIERGNWAGFRSLTTLVEYTGDYPLREAVQEYLEQRLLENWPFTNLIPVPQLAELDWNTWLVGQSRAGAVLDIKSVTPEEAVVPTEVTPPQVESGIHLFTDKDVISWERPLRVTEDSAWTVSARRLRTLMIRLAAQGRIGKDGILLENVLSGLSKEHLSCFDRLFPILVETGVLQQETTNGNHVLFLSREHLEDIQDLINRDVTTFWLPIVA